MRSSTSNFLFGCSGGKVALMSLPHGCESERQYGDDESTMFKYKLAYKGKGFKVFIYFDGEFLFIYLEI